MRVAVQPRSLFRPRETERIQTVRLAPGCLYARAKNGRCPGAVLSPRTLDVCNSSLFKNPSQFTYTSGCYGRYGSVAPPLCNARDACDLVRLAGILAGPPLTTSFARKTEGQRSEAYREATFLHGLCV